MQTDNLPLFVYGTMKKGFRNETMMSSQTFLGSAKTAPKYQLYDLGSFPGLHKGEQSIVGELYGVEPEWYAVLDKFENSVKLYRKTIELSDGRHAIAYVMSAPPIEGLKELGSVYRKADQQFVDSGLGRDDPTYKYQARIKMPNLSV